jgi:hypothetical protein
MPAPRIYADFQNLDDDNRLRLTSRGTLQDLQRHGLQPSEGLRLTFYTDDADDEGRPDELQIEGEVRFNEADRCWVAAVDWTQLRRASQERSEGTAETRRGPA